MIKAFTDSGREWELYPKIYGYKPAYAKGKTIWCIAFYGPNVEYRLEDILADRHKDTERRGLDAGGRNFGVAETVWVKYKDVTEYVESLHGILVQLFEIGAC